jgi:SAM-dependent methyltransferase
MTDGPIRLRETFASTPVSAHNDAWDALYAESFHPWDRAGPSLALADLLAQRTDLIPPSVERRDSSSSSSGTASIARRLALVPGCGLGHDVLLLSALGYDVVGLDYSARALELARENKAKADAEGRYAEYVRDGVGSGRVTWVSGDFFGTAWEADAGASKFDLIFDYTVSQQKEKEKRERKKSHKR